LSAELTKTHSFRLFFFLAILPTGNLFNSQKTGVVFAQSYDKKLY